MSDDRRVLALRHKEAAEKAKEAVGRERALRTELIAACFPDGVAGGMNNCDLGEGYMVKAEVKPEVKAPEPELKAALALMREAGDLGAELADRLVKWKPQVGLREFKALPEHFAGLFKGVVTVALGTPSVELKVPG